MSDQQNPSAGAPRIRRGAGLQLSTHAPAEPEGETAAPAGEPRRGVGLRLSTHAPAGEPKLEGLAPLRRIRLAHGELAYRQAGEGPPLLLLHGWSASSRYWYATQALLADMRLCVASDLPGFGASPPLAEPGRIERLAELVIELADALGLGTFDLGGHSFGGSVALVLAARWPERVRRLVITSFGVRRSPLERALLGATHAPASLALQFGLPWLSLWRPALRNLRPLTAQLLATPPLPSLLAGWYLGRVPDDPQLLREGVADLVEMDLGAHLACVASIGDPALLAALPAIVAPTLFVGGDCDRVVPADDLRAAADLARGEALLLPGCGHVPMIEQREAYHAALRDFLG